MAKAIGYCKECGYEVTENNEIRDPDHTGCYECPKCGHPHSRDELWVEVPTYLTCNLRLTRPELELLVNSMHCHCEEGCGVACTADCEYKRLLLHLEELQKVMQDRLPKPVEYVGPPKMRQVMVMLEINEDEGETEDLEEVAPDYGCSFDCSKCHECRKLIRLPEDK